MTIRKAILEDAASIAEVSLASWRETFRGIVPDSFLDNLDPAERTQWVAGYLKDPEVDFYAVVAEQAGEIVGYAVGGPNRSSDTTYQGELYALYLLNKVHRQGIGRQMVRMVAQSLFDRGFRNMLVGVLRDNPARGFYERLGAVYLREGVFIVDGVEITEMAYGWPDLRVLLSEHADR